MSLISLARVYSVSSPYPEHCYLVDRLWPRGISKERLAGVSWLKEVAPSNALRSWFHGHKEQWPQFVERYRAELAENSSWSSLLALIKAEKPVTFLYSSTDQQHNHAIVLRDFLLEQ